MNYIKIDPADIQKGPEVFSLRPEIREELGLA